jgi:hypothetical protein
MSLTASSDALPLIASASVGLLALAGIVTALLLRRRHDDEFTVYAAAPTPRTRKPTPERPSRPARPAVAGNVETPAAPDAPAATSPTPAVAAAPIAPVAPVAPPATAAAPAAPPLVAPPGNSQRERVVLARTYTFRRLDGVLAGLGLSRKETGAEVSSDEPESATWASGRTEVRYTYDSVHNLRLLEVRGERTNQITSDLINLACVPTMNRGAVVQTLAGEDGNELLAALRAAEFLGVDGNERHFIAPVAKLRERSSAHVSTAAIRVHRALVGGA